MPSPEGLQSEKYGQGAVVLSLPTQVRDILVKFNPGALVYNAAALHFSLRSKNPPYLFDKSLKMVHEVLEAKGYLGPSGNRHKLLFVYLILGF